MLQLYVIDFRFEKHEEVSPKVIGKMWTRFPYMSLGMFTIHTSLMSSCFYCNRRVITYVPRARFKTLKLCTPNVSLSIHLYVLHIMLCPFLRFSHPHKTQNCVCVCVCVCADFRLYTTALKIGSDVLYSHCFVTI